MVFALVADGVRSAGTNPNTLLSPIPPLFAPDSLWTQELGAKTQGFEGAVFARVAVTSRD